MAYSKEILNQIETLHLNGKSCTEIGCLLSIDRFTVGKHLKRMGYVLGNTVYKDIFNTIDTEEKAYWLGFLYADGSVHHKTGQVSIKLQKGDIEHLEKFKKFLNANNPVSFYDNVCSFAFCASEIASALINLGCTPQKSLTLKFPTDEQVPKELKHHFMRGYVDGDGSLVYTDKSYCFSLTSTMEFIEDAIKFFEWDMNSPYPSGRAFTWRSGSKIKVPQYLDTLYKDSRVYLDRKYEKYLKMQLASK